jgi:3-methyladenine DNA glycosylase AlkD
VIDAVRRGLAELASPSLADGMRAYMRSELPFRGVQKPQRTELLRRLVLEHPLDTPAEWEQVVRTLWDDASYREERYLALALTGLPRYAGWQRPALVPLYRHLIVTGAWWDYVDEIASRRIGPLLRSYPVEVEPIVREWSTDGDMWLRRTSIICQLGSKQDTDTRLLAACIEPNIDDREFFLRKAIGWALRQHAKTDPAWVRAFVDSHPRLSPLSRREAVKHL